MKTRIKKSWIFLAIYSITATILIACTSTQSRMPSYELLSSTGRIKTGIQQDSIQRGRHTAMTECAGCHRLYWPDEYTPRQWETIAVKMGKRSSLDRKQIADLQRYLMLASQSSH